MLLLGFAILAAGLGAGIWKHAGVSVAQFSVLFVVGKTLACWGGGDVLAIFRELATVRKTPPGISDGEIHPR
jgi:hypothetical protein